MATKMAIQCRQWPMHPMAPMVHLISIGANGYRHWQSLLVTIDAISMVKMVSLNCGVTARIAIKKRGDNANDGVNGDNGRNDYLLAKMKSLAPMMKMGRLGFGLAQLSPLAPSLPLLSFLPLFSLAPMAPSAIY